MLDSPEAILKDIGEGFLFIKHLKDNDYFVNVSYDKGEYLVSVSNGIKEANNLKNKLNAGAKILYQSPSFSSSRNKLLQTSQYSTNKIDNNIIPQNAEQFYDLHYKVSRLKLELKDASIDTSNIDDWFERWGEDANKAYLRHKELARKFNNPPRSFDDFNAEFQDELQKKRRQKHAT